MVTGLMLTVVSAVALALTVTADKLMVGDFYGNSSKSAWFVSAVLGTFFGVVSMFIAWFI